MKELLPVLRANLIKHEGYKREAYKDHLGHWTIGVGRLLALASEGKDYTGYIVSENTIDQMLQDDMETAIQDCYSNIPNFCSYPWGVKLVLAEMMFNLGQPRLMKFKKMLAALEVFDYITAADEMLDSLWARQVGQRANYLASIVEGYGIC